MTYICRKGLSSKMSPDCLHCTKTTFSGPAGSQFSVRWLSEHVISFLGDTCVNNAWVFSVFQCRERSTPNCSTDTRTASMSGWRLVWDQRWETCVFLIMWTFGANHRPSWLSTALVHLRAGWPGAEDGGRLRDQAEEARCQRSPVAPGDDHGGPEGLSGAQWHRDQGLWMEHYSFSVFFVSQLSISFQNPQADTNCWPLFF